MKADYRRAVGPLADNDKITATAEKRQNRRKECDPARRCKCDMFQTSDRQET